jgi:predicted ATPase
MIYKLEAENFMSLKNVSVKLDPLTLFIGPNGSGKSAIFKALVLISKLLNGTPVRGPRGELTLDQGVTLDDLVWNGNAGLPIRFRVWLNPKVEDDPDYSVEVSQRAEGWSITRERIRAGQGWIEIDENNPFEHPTEKGTKVHTAPLRATLRYLVNLSTNDKVARPVIEPILQLATTFGHAWRYRPSAIDIASFVQRPTEKGRSIYVSENGWGVAATLQDLNNNPADREVFTLSRHHSVNSFPISGASASRITI